MAQENTSRIEDLLLHASFLRSLARELVRDSARADDLVQRTWVAALEHPPGGDKPLRRWLGTVLRNFAREELRVEGSRDQREKLAARPIATDGPEELAMAMALQQSLLRAVSELGEPYRSVIYKRYYEGLAPREIAARSSVPVKSVKTQLHRGLSMLRARLDREHGGDRSAWLLALSPLTGRPFWTAHTLGAFFVDAKFKVTLTCAALIVALAGMLFVLPGLDTPSVAGSTPALRDAKRSTAESPNAPALSKPSLAERRRLEFERASLASGASGDVEAHRVHGRVLDLDRRPVAGIEIVERAEFDARLSNPGQQAMATSGADGSFEFQSSKGLLWLEARSRSFVTVLGARIAPGFKECEPIIAVARRQALSGIVQGPDGKPIAGAQIAIELAKNVRSGLGVILDQSYTLAWNLSCDGRGQFELEDAPACDGELHASSPAFESASIPLPRQPVFDLVVVLGASSAPPLVVRGTVVDEQGQPVAQAFVALGGSTTVSNSDGHFELSVDISPGTIPSEETASESEVWRASIELSSVRAVKLGHLPVFHELPPLEELRAHPDLEPIQLRLGGESLSIAGRVEDTDGLPIAGVAIWPADAANFARITSKHGLEGISRQATIESMLRGGPELEKVRSDADGRFVLDGLLDREYELVAFDARTMRSTRVQHLRSGVSDVVIRLPSERELVQIGGRVVTESGEPVAGVQVSVTVNVTELGPAQAGTSRTTDEQGRFSFRGEAAKGMRIRCSGESIVSVFDVQPRAGERLDELEIVVARQCHFQVDLADGGVDHFKALDANGEQLEIMIIRGPQTTFEEFGELHNGKSEVAVVRDSCRTLVFLDSRGGEVSRRSVSLRPGELNVYRVR